jgi:hypothetical protein
MLCNKAFSTMWFGKKNTPLPTGVITTSEGLELEVVTSLQVRLDGTLSFSQHISKLQAKVKSLDLVSSIEIVPLSPIVIEMTILPMLDYGDIIYRSAGKGAL